MMRILFRNCWAFVGLLCLMSAVSSCRSSSSTAARVRAQQATTQAFQEHFLSALCSRFSEDYKAELSHLKKAQALRPNAPEVLFELSRLTREMAGAYDSTLSRESDSLLERAAQLAPYNEDYQLALVENLETKTQFAKAAEVLNQVVRTHPTDERYQHLARLYHYSGNWQQALHTIDDWEKSSGLSYASTMRRALIYNDLQEFDKAIESASQLCQAYPTELRYLTFKGIVYQMFQHYDEARACYDSVLSVRPFDPYASLSLLNAYQEEQQDSLYYRFAHQVLCSPGVDDGLRTEVANKALNRSMKEQQRKAFMHLMHDAVAAPTATAALAGLYANYVLAHDEPVAEKEWALRHWLKLEPAQLEARRQLLLTILPQNRPQAVIDIATEGIRLHPEDWFFPMIGANSLLVQERYAEALPWVEKAIALNTADNQRALPDLYGMAGDIYDKLHQSEKACAAYAKAAELDPTNMIVLNNYAYLLSRMKKDLEHAETMSRTTIEQEPDNAVYYDTYAYILYLLHRNKDALKAMKRTLELLKVDDESEEIYRHAVLIFQAAGQADQAAFYQKKADQLLKASSSHEK